ncbi:RNA polymerase II-associated protein 3 isoform X2 [Senna tora]|uniref:RNA polymerase II-associated protein 3 isoform X2 n=1 Tax=Senna tora TaxID=362788 RepID=A0A834SME4_9FABA|nr:RNA polymerase II-associated protein 3 isoform X2 [Senna tora]
MPTALYIRFPGLSERLAGLGTFSKGQTTKDEGSSSRNTGSVGVETASRGEHFPFDYAKNTSRNNDPFSRVHSSFITEDVADAASEKELGNEYFKQKKFKEAIDCYSRSIALFQEAEDDCTEALNLDDRYIKAYSRRATARKELGKLKESMEDAEFALRLEPDNQEIKKQYADIKSLYEKAILQKASGALRSSLQGTQKVGNSETNINRGVIHPVSNGTQKSRPTEVQDHKKSKDKEIPAKASAKLEELDSEDKRVGGKIGGQEVASSSPSNTVENVKRNHRIDKQEMKVSVQHLASRAAARAMTESAKNITPPTSAYQFEVSWRGFSGDPALQTRLLKAISPQELPKIFKNALSSSLLVDIIKCVASFFTEETTLAVSYIEYLTKVSRFDMLILCLPSTDKDVLHRIWEEVFCSEATPMEYAEILDNLRSKYCPRH